MTDTHEEARTDSDKKENMEEQLAGLDRSPVLARWARIESELDDIQEYVNRERRSVQIRISKWAGVAALLVSIVVGGFAIYDNVFIGPKQRRDQDLTQLRDIILEIGRVNLDVALRSIPGNEFMNANLGLVSNGIKLPLISNAVKIVEEHLDHVPIFAFMAIIPELAQAQDHARAIEFGRYARKRTQEKEKEENIAASAEFARQIANAYMGKGGKEDRENARKIYIESIEEAKTLGGAARSWIISNTIRDWSGREAVHGNCAGSLKVFERLGTDIDRSVGHEARCAAALSIAGILRRSCDDVAGHRSIHSVMRECGM